MTAVEAIRILAEHRKRPATTCPDLYGDALLELAARLDALEAAHLKPIPRIGGGEIFPMPNAAPDGYALRPPLGRTGDQLPPQGSVAKE